MPVAGISHTVMRCPALPTLAARVTCFFADICLRDAFSMAALFFADVCRARDMAQTARRGARCRSRDATNSGATSSAYAPRQDARMRRRASGALRDAQKFARCCRRGAMRFPDVYFPSPFFAFDTPLPPAPRYAMPPFIFYFRFSPPLLLDAISPLIAFAIDTFHIGIISCAVLIITPFHFHLPLLSLSMLSLPPFST
jgi:hypothetical protein